MAAHAALVCVFTSLIVRSAVNVPTVCSLSRLTGCTGLSAAHLRIATSVGLARLNLFQQQMLPRFFSTIRHNTFATQHEYVCVYVQYWCVHSTLAMWQAANNFRGILN